MNFKKSETPKVKSDINEVQVVKVFVHIVGWRDHTVNPLHN